MIDSATLTNTSTFGLGGYLSNSEARVFRNWKHRGLRQHQMTQRTASALTGALLLTRLC
jgi:hypothetical protein